MTKEEENELNELIEAKIKEATYSGVVRGYKAAYATMVEQINLGMTLEEIKAWAIGKKKQTEIIENVMIEKGE